MSLCYFVTLLLCHFVTLSPCHSTLTKNQLQLTPQSSKHPSIQAFLFRLPSSVLRLPITHHPSPITPLSPCHFVTLLLYINQELRSIHPLFHHSINPLFLTIPSQFTDHSSIIQSIKHPSIPSPSSDFSLLTSIIRLQFTDYCLLFNPARLPPQHGY